MTFADAVQFLALNVALTAAIVAAYGIFTHREIRRQLARVDENEFFVRRLANASAIALGEIRASSEIYASLLAKVWLACGLEAPRWAAVEQRLSHDENVVQKAMQTLLLYCEEDDRRRSAVKQLGQHLGDADTLEALLELRRYEKTNLGALNLAIRTLKRRLKERHKFGSLGLEGRGLE